MKISACWITKNEAANLALSINSVKKLADELIVVDTGSTDDTVKVAGELGAQVHAFEWIGDFSAARNYAMSLAAGKVVIFLDADEYFEPELTKDDRAVVEEYFRHPEVEVIHIRRTDISKDTGLILGSGTSPRMLRNDGSFHFVNRIHEMFVHKSGRFPRRGVYESWGIKHTGYSQSVSKDKARRNIGMLEDELAAEEDGYKRFLLQSYLMREYFAQRNYRKAADYLQVTLKQGKHFDRACRDYRLDYLQRFYIAMNLAGKFRGMVSRKNVRTALVERFKRFYPTYSGALTIDLYYQMLFDYKDAGFLTQVKAIKDRLQTAMPHEYAESKEIEAYVTQRAAAAEWNRGHALSAFDYAVMGLRDVNSLDEKSLHILLRCMQGQPQDEIVLFLNSLFDFSYESVLPFLTSGLRLKGYENIFLYYMKKQIEQGNASKGDYLYFVLMNSDMNKSLRAAEELYDKENASAVASHLFLTAIISGDREIYDKYKSFLAHYNNVLDCFFDGGVLQSIGEDEIIIAHTCYPLIAFAGGMEIADRLLAVFAARDPQMCFVIRAKYCMDNCLYDELIAMDRSNIKPDNLRCHTFIINACLLRGRYSEAFGIIRLFFDFGIMDDNLFNFLSVIAENADAPLGLEARAFYDKYIELYDEIVDLNDIIATRIITDKEDKKQSRALKNLTTATFRRQLEEYSTRFTTPALLKSLHGAAAIYESEGFLVQAAHCLQRLVARGHKPEENWVNLKRVLEQVGNDILAAECERLMAINL